ncbi:hypothetical protein SERLA73DRAFT_178179 [Serpula lacrymans var. lacrymans S7.3]|uniref:Uncharacterized protein n=2 Tax=Serpula lacrymans var. lacrymans TaxID=341189 RepID=F8PQW4_SERL3|nr:uncharacterized protein SERLADRAFT_462481 [Serpula lacrymans var. lacrymans S7.9]XP_007324903.1 uncharacterized protein SERLADRAFT_481197 [Serpula lacrymans var. lacrymans S7.9]EGO02308.1 hypothetical protein SERLA73DRAFT_178179 [Serpula lacrymans var. lacrymans S7.3]EGO18366.1 hypothetical protein SERLADRAFT_481197 [Serpula lacrymans var. lacrymans S7.9]EGO28046.1 hypothetical protein SERLADRAFT_462481 [Serpula lacrymans var. lacrymans S7.9]
MRALSLICPTRPFLPTLLYVCSIGLKTMADPGVKKYDRRYCGQKLCDLSLPPAIASIYARAALPAEKQ